MVLFLGSTRCVAIDVPDTVVYGPVYIPTMLGRGARCMGHDSVRRYMSIIQLLRKNQGKLSSFDFL